MQRIADETWFLTRMATRVRHKNPRAVQLLVRAGSTFDDADLNRYPLDISESKAIEAPPENKAVAMPNDKKKR
jgi:hypothetical protein